MLEARLPTAVTLKRILDAVKDLVSDANLDCSDAGIALQAMDTSHVALVSLVLRSEGFDPFRCDRAMSLGVNFGTLSKVLKCADNNDILTLKAAEDSDVLNLTFESPKSERISEFDIKLMDVDAEHLGIPETEYSATVTLPSSEFARICNDMTVLGETVSISVVKDSIKFTSKGESGSGNVILRSSKSADKEGMDVTIALEEPVDLAFSLKYLKMFSKAASLAPQVSLSMSADVPLLVEYAMDEELGHIRFYLAPKLDDEE
ncbi:proliferating cell nuclear antigen [Catenaria anguillulae PL171]|uniref:DNA sliding clamp PCNA n=1 Tax=Catenaria anguillulae PL171 TaxID=765915 RepID=A0A1Y2HTX6_9FUNG|nr:proliferating cell nuclear antigen [Catenaria anguillulae PL171]